MNTFIKLKNMLLLEYILFNILFLQNTISLIIVKKYDIMVNSVCL